MPGNWWYVPAAAAVLLVLVYFLVPRRPQRRHTLGHGGLAVIGFPGDSLGTGVHTEEQHPEAEMPAASVLAEPRAMAPEPVLTIKGNRNSKLYHTPESPWYQRTTIVEWFLTEADAEAAGYRRWDHKRRQPSPEGSAGALAG